MATRYRGGWRERVPVGHDSRGRPVEKVAWARTKTEAVAKAAAIRLALGEGVELAGPAVTVGELLTSWLETVVKPHREVGTYDTNLQHFERYIRAPLGSRVARTVTVPQVQSWVNTLSKRMSPGTVWRARATLRAAFNYGIKIRLFSFNPAAHVDMPKNERRAPAILGADELVRFLDATAEIQMWGALYHLAAMTGLRQEELRGLLWADIDFESATVNVHRALKFSLAHEAVDSRHRREWVFGSVKTRGSAAVVDLTSDTVASLRRHRDYYRDWLNITGTRTVWTEAGVIFLTSAGGPLHQSTIGSNLRRHLANCGLPRIRFHALRHSYAALLIAADVSPKAIQDAMRHSSIRTTLDTYGHLLHAKQTERLAKLGGVMDEARARMASQDGAGSVHDRFRSPASTPDGG